MKINKFVVFAIAAIIVASVALVALGADVFSIVSVSDIRFNSQGNVWVSNVVVDQSYETLRFEKASMSQEMPGGSQKMAGSTIDVSFRQLTPNCNYQLAAQNYPLKTLFGLWTVGTVPYFELRNPTRSVPYQVAVYKDGALTDSKQVDSSALGQTTVLMADSQVKINNLGHLSGGIDCPDASGALLVPVMKDGKIVEYRLTDRASFFDKMQQILSFLNTLNIGAASTLLSSPPVSQPSSFYGLSPSLGTINESSRDLVVQLPKTAAYANVTIEVSADYADTITYFPPKPLPQIVSLTLASSWQQSNTVDMVVTIKNVGTNGTFDVIPYNSKGFVTFSPVSDKIDAAAGEIISKTFKVYGLVSGTDAACIKVIGVQSGADTTRCVTVNVIDNPNVPEPVPAPIPIPVPVPVPIQPCGNGACEFGEAVTCPQDCAPGVVESSKESCLFKKGDGIFVLTYNWTDAQALGLIAGRCDPVYNWPLFLAIIVIAIALIGGFLRIKKVF